MLVETGSQTSVPALLAALDELGVDADDLAGVAVTHIHLDHAGGVGDVAAAFPNATVYVHEQGARHLVDPTKLVNSAAMVYGDLLDSLYGRLTPTPAERVHVLADGERDQRVVEPHAHHRRLAGARQAPPGAPRLGLRDLLFAGDAVGVRLPDVGILRPATPPPDFDLDQALTSLRAVRRPPPRRHRPRPLRAGARPRGDPRRGPGDAAPLGRGGRGGVAEGRDIAEALAAAFGAELEGIDPAKREKLETLNGIHSNAAGFRRWLDRSVPRPAGPAAHRSSSVHHHHPRSSPCPKP